jgi:hypothetical protein
MHLVQLCPHCALVFAFTAATNQGWKSDVGLIIALQNRTRRAGTCRVCLTANGLRKTTSGIYATTLFHYLVLPLKDSDMTLVKDW